MIKNEVRIKENITFKDELNAIDYITASNFNIGDDGEISYTPEYSLAAEFEAIVLYLMDGIEFEKDDIIYEQIIKDEELTKLIQKFYPKDHEDMYEADAKYISIRNFILNNVQKKVDFTLQRLIHENAALNNFFLALTSIINNFDITSIMKLKDIDIKLVMSFMKKLLKSDITEESITNALKSVIKIDEETAKILDAKNAEINSLKLRLSAEK